MAYEVSRLAQAASRRMNSFQGGVEREYIMARNSQPSAQPRSAAPANRHNSSVQGTERMHLQMPPRTLSRFGQTVLFARNFLKHPNLVGWMLPSSPFVVAQVLRQIDWQRARVIVEYGPGIGTF